MKLRKPNFQENAPSTIANDEFLKYIYSEIYKTFFDLSGNDSGLKVLEIGAGGYTPALNFWQEVIVSDIEQPADQGGLIKIDSANLPFPENTFDLVIAKDSLHHFKDPMLSLTEIFRVLRENGKFIVSEPYWSPLGRFVFKFLHPETWEVNAKSHVIDSKDPWDGNQALLFLLQGKWGSLLTAVSPRVKLEIHSSTYSLSYLLSGGVHSRTRIPARVLIRINKWENNSRLIRKIFGLNVVAIFELA